MSTIIYEKSEEEQESETRDGLEQLKAYARKPFEAYQHLLILKSCTDLQKFDPRHLISIKNKHLDSLEENVVLGREISLLLKLC